MMRASEYRSTEGNVKSKFHVPIKFFAKQEYAFNASFYK